MVVATSLLTATQESESSRENHRNAKHDQRPTKSKLAERVGETRNSSKRLGLEAAFAARASSEGCRRMSSAARRGGGSAMIELFAPTQDARAVLSHYFTSGLALSFLRLSRTAPRREK